MKTLSKIMLCSVVLISALFIFGPSCQKEQVVDLEKNQTAKSANRDAQGGAFLCPCAEGGCNGPKKLKIEVLEVVGVTNYNIKLKRICSGLNNTNNCFTWNNPAQGDIAEVDITYSGSDQLPGGGFTAYYDLTTLFYFPYPPESLVKIKLSAPGINKILTFNYSTSISLYPWETCN